MTGRPGPGPDAVRPPDPRMISFNPPPPSRRTWQHPHLPAPPSPDPGERAGDAGVRPFVVTGGRTAPADDRLRIETQVVATSQARPSVLADEHRRIIELGSCPLSVAEIAAALRLPLGVARVLVSDLAATGLVAVHEPTAPVSRATIERILEHVHAL